jgi:ATP dependent DNA ligase domain
MSPERAVPDIAPEPIPGARQAPLPDKIAPQIANLSKAAPLGDQWLHEIKFDGYRMLASIDAGKARFISRNGLDWTARFPALAAALGSLDVSQAILDGEVCHELANGVTSFEALQADLPEGKTAHLVFFAFDLLYGVATDSCATRRSWACGKTSRHGMMCWIGSSTQMQRRRIGGGGGGADPLHWIERLTIEQTQLFQAAYYTSLTQ